MNNEVLVTHEMMSQSVADPLTHDKNIAHHNKPYIILYSQNKIMTNKHPGLRAKTALDNVGHPFSTSV